MQTIDRIIEEGEKKINIRKQLRGFGKELGKIIATLMFTVILPFILMTGRIPPAEFAVLIIGCGLLCFTIILIIISRLFYTRDTQHKHDIYGMAKNFRDSNDEVVNMYMIADKRWRSRFTGLEDRMGCGIIEIDLNKKEILNVNSNLRAMLGTSKKELNESIKEFGDSELLSLFVHSEDIERYRKVSESFDYAERLYLKNTKGIYFPAKVKSEIISTNGFRVAQVFIYDLTESDGLNVAFENQSRFLSEMTCNLLGMNTDRDEAKGIIDLMKEEGDTLKDV